jgi:hypothetical protein
MRTLFVIAALLATVPVTAEFSLQADQPVTSARPLLVREYADGERLAYRLTTTRRNGTGTTTYAYAATARATVKRDPSGKFIEEFQWGDLVSNGAPFTLPAASQSVRQVLWLRPDAVPTLPDFATIHPRLIGAAADLMNFYVDVWLAMQQPMLRQAGDRVSVPHGGPNSWADGTQVILGEDAIDFVLSIEGIDRAKNTITLVVNHVPPDRTYVRTPVAWMRDPLGTRPNNWIQVTKASDMRFVASVGVETFDVRVVVNLATGKILSAEMDNPVQVLERECSDPTLTICGEPVRYQIVRQVAISEVPPTP